VTGSIYNSLEKKLSVQQKYELIGNDYGSIMDYSDEYPETSVKAPTILLPFSTSYLRGQGFAAPTNMNCKKREKLVSVDEEMRGYVCRLFVQELKIFVKQHSLLVKCTDHVHLISKKTMINNLKKIVLSVTKSLRTNRARRIA